MSKKTTKRHKGLFRKRKATVFLVVSLLVIVCIYLFMHGKNTIPAEGSVRYKPPRGGSTKIVNDNYSNAINAWKSGDKSKAKTMALKALEENDNLTIKQQETIPNQLDKMYILYSITQGTYNGD